MIYTQKIAWQCWQYAILNALQHMWVAITEEEILALGTMMGFLAMQNKLTKAWYIKSLTILWSEYLVDMWIKKQPLVAKLIKNNFSSVHNPPYINDFKGTMWHFVCLIEDMGDKYRYIDQQWENFWDKWCWYILKSDFKNLTVVKLNV